MTAAVEFIAVDSQFTVTVSLAAVGAPFAAVLTRAEHRWFDDDPTPDILEYVVCEHTITAPLPSVFAAVDDWLVREHKLRVPPHLWTVCDAGGDAGCALLLEGRAVPAHPLRGPLGHWG